MIQFIMIQGIEVIDFHSHFPNSGEWFPDYNFHITVTKDNRVSKAQAELWRAAFNFPVKEAEMEDDKAASDMWYRDILKKGIEKIVFVSGGGNDRLSKIVSYHSDRFIGFAHHNPFSKDALGKLKHAVEDLGMKGYKILAPALDEPLNSKKLYPLWAYCGEKEIPVLIHFGILGAAGGVSAHENINPLMLHDVAKDFPDVSFVLPHFGAGYPTELLHLCWTSPNVFVDTSGSNQWIRWMAYKLTLEDLFRKFYETIGPERIIFATDSSWFPRMYAYSYLEEQHRIMRFLRFSRKEIKMILSGNARKLLKLDL